ncbi:MAG: ATP-binding protein [Quisquiliibacterium sp.]
MTVAEPDVRIGSSGAAILDASGLPESLVIDLLLRHLARTGSLRGVDIASRLGMPLSALTSVIDALRMQRLLDVTGRGAFDAGIEYVLTDAGRSRAREAFERCQYLGPLPVSLAEYTTRVAQQSVRQLPLDEGRLSQAIGDAVVSPDLIAQLGAALVSDRALYLYGASGTGKTFLAERLLDALSGEIDVPHAIFVDGEIIQVYDPVVHRAADATATRQSTHLLPIQDHRWVRAKRPVVITGGELTNEMLDLKFERQSRFYVAPPQVKANNGMLIIDDLGRQRVSARELLNRWIVPLDRGFDHMALHTGFKFEVPFDVKVLFSSNLAPSALGDPAFVRRLGYKIHLGPLDAASYRTVIQQACIRAGVPYVQEMANWLIEELHQVQAMPLYPAIPYDLVAKLRDKAVFEGCDARLTREGLRWAWNLYFAPDQDDGEAPTLDQLR